MENNDGNAGTTVGLESADSSSTAVDQPGIQVGCPIDHAEAEIERAIDQLTYGRRQEAEAAIAHLTQALFYVRFAKAPRQG